MFESAEGEGSYTKASSTRRPPTRWRSSRRSTRSWRGATSAREPPGPRAPAQDGERPPPPAGGRRGTHRLGARRSSRTAAAAAGSQVPLRRTATARSSRCAIWRASRPTPPSSRSTSAPPRAPARQLLTSSGELERRQLRRPAGRGQAAAAARLLPRGHDPTKVVIDRGDVWYDFPFDSAGKRLSPAARALPAHHGVHRLRGPEDPADPLAHHDRLVAQRDVQRRRALQVQGLRRRSRVWKEIVAAPVWIPPATTPPRELVRRKWKDGRVRTVVNNAEFGPQLHFGLRPASPPITSKAIRN